MGAKQSKARSLQGIPQQCTTCGSKNESSTNQLPPQTLLEKYNDILMRNDAINSLDASKLPPEEALRVQGKSEEERARLLSELPKELVLGITEVWIAMQPDEEQERLQRYFVARLFESDFKSLPPRTIASASRNRIEEAMNKPELPPYSA